jgi:hypothetical protein
MQSHHKLTKEDLVLIKETYAKISEFYKHIDEEYNHLVKKLNIESEKYEDSDPEGYLFDVIHNTPNLITDEDFIEELTRFGKFQIEE